MFVHAQKTKVLPTAMAGKVFRFASCAVLAIGAAGEEYYAKLSNIHSTVGVWDPAFNPDVTVYNIKASPTTTSVTLEFDVDYNRYMDSGPPLMAVTWNNTSPRLTYTEAQPATFRVPLGDSPYGASVNLTVVVAGPPDPDQMADPDVFRQTLYLLQILRDPDPDQTLRLQQLVINDDHQRELTLQPPFAINSTSRTYEANVTPDVARVRVTPSCDSKATAQVSGHYVAANSYAWAGVSDDASYTILRVGCKYGADERDIIINLRESVSLADAVRQLELRVLGDEGSVQRLENSSFLIRSSDDEIRFVPVDGDSHVSMILQVPDGAPYPLGIGVPSPPLAMPDTGTTVYSIRLGFGEDTQYIQVILERFATTTLPAGASHSSQSSVIGCLTLGITVSCLGLSLLVVACAAASGLGSVRHRAIAVPFRSLTFVLQFLSLSNVVRVPCGLTDFTQPILWLSLMPPSTDYMETGMALSVTTAQAAVCLQYCVGALLTLALVHLLLLIGGPLRCGYYTAPYQLRFGAFEIHCLLHLVYPVSAAATLLLLSDSSALTAACQQQPYMYVVLTANWYRAGACAALLLPVVIALLSMHYVHIAVQSGQVVWISKQDSGINEDGFYCDAVCDQLSTRLVSRIVAGGFLPIVQWGTTVADIRPIKLSASEADSKTAEDSYILVGKDDEDDEEIQVDEDPVPSLWVPDASKILEVQVLSTVKLVAAHREACCAEVGHFANIPWLRAHLSVDSMLRLHHEVDHQIHDWAMPLAVRAEQLQGPLTSGSLSFCFEGLRWPHWSPAEIVLRVALGVLMGMCSLGSLSLIISQVAVAVLIAGFVTALMHEPPCTALVENALLLLTYLGVALIAFSYIAYTVGVFSESVCSGVVLLIAACVVLPLSAHTLVATALLGSVVMCPAGSAEEHETLEQCNVDLALRGPNGSWLLIVPAECSVPVSDAFVHALPAGFGDARVYSHFGNIVKGSKPRLEFPVLDYLAPTDKLEPPLAVLFGISRDGDPGMGVYRSECIYPDEDPWMMTLEFAKRGPKLDMEYAPEVAREILELVRNHARAGEILVVSIVQVPRLAPQRRAELSDGSEGEEMEALVASARSWR